jgi:DNA polymerase-3 subunit gamma/tau
MKIKERVPLAQSNWANEYRPRDLDEVAGQAIVVATLRRFIARGAMPHAVLLIGPSGAGKTTIARLIAKSLDVSRHGMVEVDAATYSGIDAMRELAKTAQFRALDKNPTRFIIIDECHALSKPAWQSLLKVLEEPPPHLHFALCSTAADAIPVTVKTRCTPLLLRPIADEPIVRRLRDVAHDQRVDVSHRVLREVARASRGSLRWAINALQQVADLDENSALAHVDALADMSC